MTEELFPTTASEGAKAMSALGASKGGKARASTLTPEERKEIARNAVRARWRRLGKLKEVPEIETSQIEPAELHGPNLPFSMFPGELELGPLKMECHVLNDGRRVFTQREIVKALSGGRESGDLNRYLDRNPVITNESPLGPEIPFKVPGSSIVAIGREATGLIEICETYLEARDRGLLKGSQKKLATQSEIIIRACAKVGIIALIDEATGFQQFRAKKALQIKLQAFISDALQR